MLKYELINNNKEEWLVFIHGIAGSTKTWKKQINFFSQKYNLLLLDLPGHGSNADNVIEHVDETKLNNGIKETLDFCNIQKAHFVGLSLGTLIIASFAVAYPEYIESIIYGGAVFNISVPYKLCVKTANLTKKIIPYEKMYSFLAWFMLPKKNHKLSRQIFLREAKKLNRKTMFAYIEYLSKSTKNKKIKEALSKLNVKQLFITGDEDHCFITGIRKINNILMQTRLHIIKHCGHICSIEKFAEFNQSAMNFLSSISSKKTMIANN